MTEFNAGTASAFDERSDKSVETHVFDKPILVITEPADTVGSAKGVLKGEGSGNKPPSYTREADVTTYAACRPENDDTIYADGSTDFVRDTEITNPESTSLDPDTSVRRMDSCKKVTKGDKITVLEAEPSERSLVETESGKMVRSRETSEDEVEHSKDALSSISKFATHVRNTSDEDPVNGTDLNVNHKRA